VGLTLAIDFGSTYTKLVALDLAREDLIGVFQSKSTVDSDITFGLNNALKNLSQSLGHEPDIERILACSSAAGGLRIVAIGLVKVLTTKAAEEAALGAGAKLVGTYSFGLTDEDVSEIEADKPDLILLTGGTDGGNRDVLVNNAILLAGSRLDVPIVIAGNRIAAREAYAVLKAEDKYAVVEQNVLPELDQLNVEPTRARIRDIFMKRITHAKGLDRAKALVGDIIMPTPMAVLKAATLLAEGTTDEKGLGELVVVDIGGATTDVHSVATGQPADPNTVVKGLPEPYEKRTVEGDLGLRYNAQTILEKAGSRAIMRRIACIDPGTAPVLNLAERVACLTRQVDLIPCCEEDALIDVLLASAAADMAMQRHAGVLRESYLACGRVQILSGKDLMAVRTIIGTGGVFAYGSDPFTILKAAAFNNLSPESMRPLNPAFFIDERYMLYAAGLLCDVAPTSALRIMKKHLKELRGTA
jgi:uncharacterized protein (TIGR01319 family)